MKRPPVQLIDGINVVKMAIHHVFNAFAFKIPRKLFTEVKNLSWISYGVQMTEDIQDKTKY